MTPRPWEYGCVIGGTFALIFMVANFLAVAGGTSEPYSPDAFGDWDGYCLDSREQAILRWAEEVAIDGCKLGHVELLDPYTGQWYIGPSSGIDIDHVVPKKEAWDSGLDHGRLTEFFNDSLNLIPTAASVNRSKGERDPAQWMPPDGEAHCFYVSLWREIKEKYQLDYDAREYWAIWKVERACR